MEHLFLHCTALLENQYGIYLSLFLGGLIGSFAHCSFMCSPFILSQISEDKSEKLLTRLSGAALIPYHLGRITSYMSLAAILFLFSSAILSNPLKAMIVPILLCVAAVMFIVMAIPVLQKKLRFPIPFWARFVEKSAHPFMYKQGGIKQYILGSLLGFLPCGLVYAALMLTITLPTPIEAAFGMMIFGVGTLPLLLTIAFMGRTAFSKISFLKGDFRKGLMIFNALNLFMIAGLKIT